MIHRELVIRARQKHVVGQISEMLGFTVYNWYWHVYIHLL